MNYGPDFEAYTFDVRPNRVQVVWAKTDQVLQVFVPGEKYLAAYGRDGGLSDTNAGWLRFPVFSWL